MKKRLLSLTLALTVFTSIFSTTAYASKSKDYIVKKGDTLYSIGKAHDISWNELAENNDIEEPYTIYVNQKLSLSKAESKDKVESLEGNNKVEEKEEVDKTEEVEDYSDYEWDSENWSDIDWDSEEWNDDDWYDEEWDEEAWEEEYFQLTLRELGLNEWAYYEIMHGDFYNIYLSFDDDTMLEKGFQTLVSRSAMNEFLLKLDKKLEQAESFISSSELTMSNTDSLTVEDVIQLYYKLLSSNTYDNTEFNLDLDAVEYMTQHGIYKKNVEESDITEFATYEQIYLMGIRLIEHVYNTTGDASEGLLWQVTDGTTTYYLLGSIHTGKSSIFPFSDTLTKAYEESDAVYVESDPTNIYATLEGLSLGVYEEGDSLENHISQETYELLNEYFQSIDMKFEDFSNLKPWYLSMLIETLEELSTLDDESMSDELVANEVSTEDDADEEYTSGAGIDMIFIYKAYLDGKEILELEGAASNFKMMNNMSPELQEILLLSELSKLDPGYEEVYNTHLDAWFDYWKDGNVQEFSKSVDSGYDSGFGEIIDPDGLLYEEYHNALIMNRDKEMAKKIDSLFESGDGKTYFIIAGSAHFLTETSILEHLELMGYMVEQVK